MNDKIDEPIDVLLRSQFEGPVPDDGFCARVMNRLPVRRQHTSWPLVAGIIAGLVACWFSLSSAPIAITGWQDWFAGEVTDSAVILFMIMTCMSILALVWTFAEVDDQYNPSSRRIMR